MSETAVLLCGHGSRDPEAVGEFEEAAAALRARLPPGRFCHRLSRIRRPIGEAS
jgi:sirohydrochlorin ferrochelatase